MLAALDTIPGVDRIGAISIVAETGGDMQRFPTAGHLCSWGAMCPGQNESAGKRRSGKTRKGNRYLRATLIQAAWPRCAQTGSALQARYHRVKRHRGHKKAVVAVGHQILEIAYYVMRDGVTYHELGADYFTPAGHGARRAAARPPTRSAGLSRHRSRKPPECLRWSHFLSRREVLKALLHVLRQLSRPGAARTPEPAVDAASRENVRLSSRSSY